MSLAVKLCSFLGRSRAETHRSPGRVEQGLYFSSAVGLGALYTEPFVFPFRSNTGQPGLLFFTLVRKIEKESLISVCKIP